MYVCLQKTKGMQYNKKNILFKVLAKNFRRVKEMRSLGALWALDRNALMKEINRAFPQILDMWEVQTIITEYKGNMRCLCPRRLIVRGEVRESLKKAFTDFLNKKGLFDRFHEYKRHNAISLHKLSDDELSENVLYWISSSGFYWNDTREGFAFWSVVNHEWHDFCLATTILNDSDKVRENVLF